MDLWIQNAGSFANYANWSIADNFLVQVHDLGRDPRNPRTLLETSSLAVRTCLDRAVSLAEQGSCQADNENIPIDLFVGNYYSQLAPRQHYFLATQSCLERAASVIMAETITATETTKTSDKSSERSAMEKDLRQEFLFPKRSQDKSMSSEDYEETLSACVEKIVQNVNRQR